MTNSRGKLSKAAAALFCMLGVAAGSAAPSRAQDALWRTYYSAAQKEYQRGNLGESESLLQTALSASTKTDESLSAYFYLAHVCVRQEKFDEAERCYKILLDGLGTKTWAVLRPPDGTPDWEQTAAEVEQTSETSTFKALLKKRPPQLLSVRLAKPITIVDVLGDYGTLLQLMKRYDEAERCIRQALILADCRPDQAVNYEAKLLQKLSLLYAAQGRAAEREAVDHQLVVARNVSMPDFDKVVNNALKAVDRLGHNSHSQAIRFNNLALFCATHGDYARAQSLFNRAISCMNESPERHKKDRALILSNYSDLLLAMGLFSEGTQLNQQATSLAGLTEDSSKQSPQKARGY